MVVHTAQLAPRQRIVIEELIGRRLLDHETISLCTCGAAENAGTGRETPAEKSRRLMAAMDCAERRMTDAEWAASLLDSGRDYPA